MDINEVFESLVNVIVTIYSINKDHCRERLKVLIELDLINYTGHIPEAKRKLVENYIMTGRWDQIL